MDFLVLPMSWVNLLHIDLSSLPRRLSKPRLKAHSDLRKSHAFTQ